VIDDVREDKLGAIPYSRMGDGIGGVFAVRDINANVLLVLVLVCNAGLWLAGAVTTSDLGFTGLGLGLAVTTDGVSRFLNAVRAG
jgi:hypothetical protein